MPIRILDAATVGRIAAGEVVERPSSVVKELVENSLDAGATAVTVEIRGGGIDYLRVTDNGCGIEPGQVRLAFENHATSKLQNAEQLDDIRTLGFRGEALPSIASVSHVEMTTRARNQDSGMRVSIDGGQNLRVQEAGCPEGTTFVMRDLFYNIPVRRAFLKKPSYEGGLVGDVTARLMLGNPGVSMRFVNNGTTVYHTFGDGKLRHAVFAVYGKETAEKMIELDAAEGGTRVYGMIGVGELAKSTRAHQMFFINGRSVRCALLSKALEQVCRSRVTIGMYPMCALNLVLPPNSIDVNVHPNKLEVRFRDEILTQTVVEKLLGTAFEGERVLDWQRDAAPPRTVQRTVTVRDITPEALKQRNEAETAQNPPIPDKKPEKPVQTQMFADALDRERARYGFAGTSTGTRGASLREGGGAAMPLTGQNAPGGTAGNAQNANGPIVEGGRPAARSVTASMPPLPAGASAAQSVTAAMPPLPGNAQSARGAMENAMGDAQAAQSFGANRPSGAQTVQGDAANLPVNAQAAQSLAASMPPLPGEATRQSTSSDGIVGGKAQNGPTGSANPSSHPGGTANLPGNAQAAQSLAASMPPLPGEAARQSTSSDGIVGGKVQNGPTGSANPLSHPGGTVNLPPLPNGGDAASARPTAGQSAFSGDDSQSAAMPRMPELPGKIESRPAYRVVGVAFKTYIILEVNDTLLLIDQHAAHERLRYEMYCRQLESGTASQQLLTPLIVRLSEREMALIMDNIELLSDAGYTVEPFGEHDIQVRAVPHVLGKAELKPLFMDMLNSLNRLKAATLDARRAEIMQMACKSAVKGGDALSESEIDALIGEMLETGAPPTCPHGRPVVKQVSRRDLEKLFKRIQ